MKRTLSTSQRRRRRADRVSRYEADEGVDGAVADAQRQSHDGPEHEDDEMTLIAESDAPSDQQAVVVTLEHARPAVAAVVGARRTSMSTDRTRLRRPIRIDHLPTSDIRVRSTNDHPTDNRFSCCLRSCE